STMRLNSVGGSGGCGAGGPWTEECCRMSELPRKATNPMPRIPPTLHHMRRLPIRVRFGEAAAGTRTRSPHEHVPVLPAAERGADIFFPHTGHRKRIMVAFYGFSNSPGDSDFLGSVCRTI